MTKTFRHACRFLAGNEDIAGYLDKIERDARLFGDVRKSLPPPLDAHCLHARLDRGVLTLIADSPVWSSRLRFFAPELERAIGSRYGAIASCRIRIQPKVDPPRRIPTDERRHKLSPRTAKHLIDAAAGIEDEGLAAALRRLAEAGAKRG